MPSGFSDLKFELMQTGENSGTWGTITNTNIGTAIEEAMVGQATVNFPTDADLTITLTNTPTTQPARHFSLLLTSSGALTATRALTVPAIDKTYMVINATTGGQAITVKNSTGSGVTIPNNFAALLYNDGTNVLPMFNFIPGALIGTLSLSNALSVPSGGTGAATLTGLVVGNGTSAMTAVTAPTGAVVGTTDTQTLTNKRINARMTVLATAGATATPNGDTTDEYAITAQDQAVNFANISGSPTDGQRMIIRIKDNGTARLLTWSAATGGYRSVGSTLPVTTSPNKTTYVGCLYNASALFWDVVAVAQET